MIRRRCRRYRIHWNVFPTLLHIIFLQIRAFLFHLIQNHWRNLCYYHRSTWAPRLRVFNICEIYIICGLFNRGFGFYFLNQLYGARAFLLLRALNQTHNVWTILFITKRTHILIWQTDEREREKSEWLNEKNTNTRTSHKYCFAQRKVISIKCAFVCVFTLDVRSVILARPHMSAHWGHLVFVCICDECVEKRSSNSSHSSRRKKTTTLLN